MHLLGTTLSLYTSLTRSLIAMHTAIPPIPHHPALQTATTVKKEPIYFTKPTTTDPNHFKICSLLSTTVKVLDITCHSRWLVGGTLSHNNSELEHLVCLVFMYSCCGGGYPLP
jgi:hypothetical protein